MHAVFASNVLTMCSVLRPCWPTQSDELGFCAYVRGVAWLRIHEPFLQKARKEYERAHGISPHLAVLLKEFVKA